MPAKQLVATLRSWPRRSLRTVVFGALGWCDAIGWVPSGRTSYLGHDFVYPLDSLIGRQIARGQQWDEILATIIPQMLPMDDPVIYEVGSNIGASLVQIKRAKPLARVVAFEPSDRFRPFLERNVGLAGMHGVHLSASLLGRSPGPTWLYNNSASASTASPRDKGVLPPRRKQAATIETLDQRLDGDPGDPGDPADTGDTARTGLDFLKVDTDGFDFEVLRGGAAAIERYSPVLYFEFFPELLADPAADLKWLNSLGYRRWVCFDPAGQLVGTTTDTIECLTWAKQNQYCDVLTCRDGSPAEPRVDLLLDSLPIRNP